MSGKVFQAEGLADAKAQRWGTSEEACPRRQEEGLPWWSSGQDSALPMQGTWVQSLVRELRSCMLQPKKKKDSAWSSRESLLAGLLSTFNMRMCIESL